MAVQQEGRRSGVARKEPPVLGLVIALVIIWVVLGVVGFAVKTLSWLIFLALVLLLLTLVLGGFGLRRRRPTR